ncbi:MAG: glycosyltransferase family 39 protein, partial [Planctomycetota bacterium]
MDTEQPSTPTARLLGWLGALAIAAVVGFALASTLELVRYQPGSDEGYYLHYMEQVSEGGLGAFPAQFHYYLGEERHWIFPPPSRVGFIALSALWATFRDASLRSLSELSLAAHLALVLAMYGFASRWFGATKGLLVAALVAFSTLALGLARHALTDSVITLTQFLALALFYEYVRAPERRWRALAFAGAFTFAILTKEIAVLLALPLALWAAAERWQRARDIPVARTMILLAVPALVALATWIVAAGSPFKLFKVLRIVLLSPATNDYAIRYGSGGWFRYPVDEILMSPWPTLLGLLGIGVALWRWKRGEYGSLAVLLALVYIAQVATLGFFTKNLRYVAILEIPLRVLSVVLLWELFSASRS